MKKYFWGGCKIIIPLAVIYWVGKLIAAPIVALWNAILFRHLTFFDGWAYWPEIEFILSFALTVASFFFIGYLFYGPISERIGIAYLLRKLENIPFIGHFLAAGSKDQQEGKPCVIEVLPGLRKYGLLTGEMDIGGMKYATVLLVTGPGDHYLADPQTIQIITEPGLMSMLKHVGSFMFNGPRRLVTVPYEKVRTIEAGKKE